MNKHKGQLGFPLKTKSPSVATAGGNPPPPKNGPIFRKKTVANVPSTPRPKFWGTYAGHEWLKGEEVRAGDILRLR
jgi:hypothetical protein